MQKQPPRAAGILIAAGAIGGFLFGLGSGQANWWALIGTLAGIALAVALWLFDRGRR